MPDEISKCPLCGWDAKVRHLADTDRMKCELWRIQHYWVASSSRAFGQ